MKRRLALGISMLALGVFGAGTNSALAQSPAIASGVATFAGCTSGTACSTAVVAFGGEAEDEWLGGASQEWHSCAPAECSTAVVVTLTSTSLSIQFTANLASGIGSVTLSWPIIDGTTDAKILGTTVSGVPGSGVGSAIGSGIAVSAAGTISGSVALAGV